jgi:hypothetical protein
MYQSLIRSIAAGCFAGILFIPVGTVALAQGDVSTSGPVNSGNHAMGKQPKIIDDAIASAKWIANALSQSGYKADFSLQSLKEIDRFFDEQTTDGQPNPGGLLSEQLGARLFAIGAYVGEVIRRQREGSWEVDERDPQAEINIAIRLKTGAVFWPVKRVMKRFGDGAEDSIWVYGMRLVQE